MSSGQTKNDLDDLFVFYRLKHILEKYLMLVCCKYWFGACKQSWHIKHYTGIKHFLSYFKDDNMNINYFNSMKGFNYI